jgi:hypothetical protein
VALLGPARANFRTLCNVPWRHISPDTFAADSQKGPGPARELRASRSRFFRGQLARIGKANAMKINGLGLLAAALVAAGSFCSSGIAAGPTNAASRAGAKALRAAGNPAEHWLEFRRT